LTLNSNMGIHPFPNSNVGILPFLNMFLLHCTYMLNMTMGSLPSPGITPYSATQTID